MPELPEVETVCRGLAAALVGHRLASVSVRRPDLRLPFPPQLAERLAGRRVERIVRRAKYMLVFLDDDTVLLGHLGMSGRILVGPSDDTPPGRHDHVVLETDQGCRVVFQDPRRFGMLDLVPAAALAEHPQLRGLGPEPLEPSFTAAVLSRALAERSGPIKPVLLDQKVVAGLGNIYVCEALFRAGISPVRPASTVAGRRAERLVPAIRAVLAEAIEAGGSSLRDHRQPNGELGYFQHSFAVYDREDQPCPGCTCREGVRRIVQAGRSTFYCAKCQR